MGQELLGLALGLVGAVLAGALLTLAPRGAEGSFTNIAGALGERVASSMTRAFGFGAWIVPGFALAWAVACLRGAAPKGLARKALLLPILVVMVSILAALLMPAMSVPGIARSGPGGYVGISFAVTLMGIVGKASAFIVLAGILALLRFIVDLDPGRALAWMGSMFGMGGATAAPAKPRKKRATKKKPQPVAEDATEEDEEDDEAEGDWEYEDEPEAEDEEEWEYEDDEEAEGEDDGDWEWVEEDEAELEDEEYEDDEEDEEPAPPPRKPAPITLTRRKPSKPRPVRLKERGEYRIPSLDLLRPGTDADPEAIREEVAANVKVLEETLASFGVDARVVSSVRGPVITFCEIKVPSGVRLNRVTKLADDLAIALKAPSIRIVAPIPGRSTVGIEVPNLQRDVVGLRDLLEEAEASMDRKAVPIVLGRDTSGRGIVEDLATMPHALIAGATGSGKSVCINSLLLSILFTRGPEEVNMILIDPKQVELSFYEGIPHLLTPVVTDMKKAAKILDWAVERMEQRYAQLLAAGVRNIKGFNDLSKEKLEKIREKRGMTLEELPEKMSYIIIVVDELADLILTIGKDVERAITRLAQKSRAVGIHVVLATQRPSTNVITGLIKANMPTRISFVVSSKIDSRVVLDANGAEKLLGMGDMLYMHPRSLSLRRAQGCLVTDAEARDTVDYLKEQYPEPEYEDLLAKKEAGLGDPMAEDDLYDDAVRAVLTTKLGSASMLQRRLGIGYTRASRLVDMMCDRGVVGPHVGSKAREVFYELEEWEGLRDQERALAAAKSAPMASDAFDPEDPPCVDESWD